MKKIECTQVCKCNKLLNLSYYFRFLHKINSIADLCDFDTVNCIHGQCIAENGAVRCECDPGYAGEACDLSIHPFTLLLIVDILSLQYNSVIYHNNVVNAYLKQHVHCIYNAATYNCAFR